MKETKRWIALVLAITLVSGLCIRQLNTYMSAEEIVREGEESQESLEALSEAEEAQKAAEEAAAKEAAREAEKKAEEAAAKAAAEEAAKQAAEEKPEETEGGEIVAGETQEAGEVIDEGETDGGTDGGAAEGEGFAEETIAQEEIPVVTGPQTLVFENDDVIITVSEETEGIIPRGVTLCVTEIRKDGNVSGEGEAVAIEDADTGNTAQQETTVEELAVSEKAAEEAEKKKDEFRKDILKYDEVKKIIDEKSEGTGYAVAGFLAYDITLMDVNGNEVEPNGEVKVAIDYKKATAPEGIDESLAREAEITVLHLEEDHKGEVEEVVDLAEFVEKEKRDASEETVRPENKIETLETDQNNHVELTEFETNGFSVYTITWNVKEGSNSQKENIENGNYLIYTKSGNTYYALKSDGTAVELGEDVGIGMVSDSKFDYVLSTADYGKLADAGVIWNKSSVYDSGYNNNIDVYANGDSYINLNGNATANWKQWIIYNGQSKRLARYAWGTGKWVETEWLSFDSATQTFSSVTSVPGTQIYLAKIAYDTKKPKLLQTVDTRSEGIIINLFDYYAAGADNKDYTAPSTTNYAVKGINKNHSLKFTPSGRDKNEWDGFGFNEKQKLQNTFMGEKVYKPRTGILESTLSGGYPILESDSESLSYLFDLNPDGQNKKVYADVNHLFLKDDKTGAYYYSSGILNSKLITDSRMTSGKYAYYNSNTGGGDFVVYDGFYYTEDNRFPMGFFPFNDYNSSKRKQNGPEQYNHHFGLTLEAPFVMTHDKKVGPDENRQNIQFGFSGDDDMWVFVDDVLVLDLGGVHEPVGGNIDFTTGKVWTQTSETGGTTKTLSNIFDAVGKTWNDNPGSKHTIKCFYMERGGQYSNLSLMINVPPEETAIPVEKIWQDAEINHDDYSVTVELQRRLEGTTDEDRSYTAVQSQVLNKDNKWRHTFSGLQQYDDQGKKYIYRIKETAVMKNGQDVTQNYERTTTVDEAGKVWVINHKAGTPSISVEKIFTGLSWDEIQEVKNRNFTITLNGTLDSGTVITPKTVKLDSTQPAPKLYYQDSSGNWIEFTTTAANGWDADTKAKARNYKYLWVIEGLGTGKYTATESNAEYEPYHLETEGIGTQVTVNESTWKVDATGMAYYTDCSSVEWKMGAFKLFAITPKSKGSEKFCLVYSNEKLTSAQQLAVKKMTQDIDPTFLTGGSYTQFTYEFFSGDELNYPGKSYDGNSYIYIEADGNLAFRSENGKDAKSAWQHICAGSYKWSGGKSAEITVKNIYSLLPNLDLEKVSTSDTTNLLSGAVFALAKYNEEKLIAIDKFDAIGDVTVDTTTDPDLESLEAGLYRLKEKTAPVGYSLLDSEIYFKVSKKEADDPNDHTYKIELCDKDGNVQNNTQDLWNLSGNETKGTDTQHLKLTIKNALLYSLPSSGGVGIYTTTLLGVSLMILAMALGKRKQLI